MGLLALALIAPEPREARRRAKLGAGLLHPGDVEGALEKTLRLRRVSFRR
jgi:hypothetical protein